MSVSALGCNCSVILNHTKNLMPQRPHHITATTASACISLHQSDQAATNYALLVRFDFFGLRHKVQFIAPFYVLLPDDEQIDYWVATWFCLQPDLHHWFSHSLSLCLSLSRSFFQSPRIHSLFIYLFILDGAQRLEMKPVI